MTEDGLPPTLEDGWVTQPQRPPDSGHCTLRAARRPAPPEPGSGNTRARPQSLVILAAFRFLPPSRLLRSWTQAHGFEPRRYRVWPWTSSQRRSPPTSPSGPAPTPRVSLRPPSGFAVSSPVSVPSRPGCHRQASPRREPGPCSWRHLARRRSASPAAAAYPFGGRGAAGPASAGTCHRAAPHARRPPSAICGPTAAGAPRHLARSR